MKDKTLRQYVLAELEFEPSIRGETIEVAADKGTVTLKGHVRSFAEKMAAEASARRVRGVKDVVQEIEVRPSDSHEPTDKELAGRVLSLIHWLSVVPNDAIQVQVQKGWVTLSGLVDWQYQKMEVADAVKGLAGVRNVLNIIDVKQHASVDDVRKRIRDALKRCAELAPQEISVKLDKEKVTLKGKVASWSQRDAAERAAWSVPGVRFVEDRITIAH
ncbi:MULTISPECIES: BON domain-containing protein [unclassified Mesorhizobium]|uniref:BON domain-containing protein n=1 Tax=unclassified Mesorhizobium TaxID=325217 RepID=UPI00301553E3